MAPAVAAISDVAAGDLSPIADRNDAPPTEVMAAVTMPDDGLSEPASDSSEPLADDGRRTTVMAAVDIDAIVAAAEAEDDASQSGSAPADKGDDKKKSTRGKRKRGR
jgi:hypothetical protein